MSELNERNIIASLSNIEAILALYKRKVKADDFLFHKEKLEFVLQYTKQYGSPPPLSVLQEKFSDFGSPEADSQALGYYVDELKKDALERSITGAIEKDLALIRENPQQALIDLSNQFGQLLSQTVQDVSHTDRDALERLSWYEEKRALRAKGLIPGIPTGLKYFNEKREGFTFGSLVSVLGFSWVGKSWLLLRLGIQAYLAGYKVLTVSCEMTKKEQELRFDTLLGNIKGYQLNFTDLKNGGGNLSDEYRRYLEDISGTDNWIMTDASDIENLEASSISQFVDTYKPDVLLIDGMEMLQEKMGRNRQGWEEAKMIIGQAKNIATSRNILVMCTAQSGRQAADRMPRPKDVAYSFDVYRASDYMISMARDQEGDESDEDNKIRYYSIIKERNGSGHIKRIKMIFDPVNGVIKDDDIQ